LTSFNEQSILNEEGDYAMNTLIPGARFSVRASREQRLREKLRIRLSSRHGGEVSSFDDWRCLADGLVRNDPDGTKLIDLLDEAKK
jgi:hypothetical protein